MPAPSPSGPAEAPFATPTPIILPPSATGYRRQLVAARGVTVYADRHPPNEWGEHVHTQVQGAVLLNEADLTVRWQTPDGVWHEQVIHGPACWLIPAGMPHTLHCPQEADLVTLFMERPFVLEILRHEVTEFLTLSLAQLASCDLLAGQLARTFRPLCAEEDTERPFYVACVGATLAAHLLQGMFGLTSARHDAGGLSPEMLQKLIRHIDEFLGTKLRLDDLAALVGMCRSRLTEAFKVSLGLTVCTYISRRRVEKARQILETTDLKEIDIAHACGFSDDTSLARAFRRILGCTPREIRAQRPR